MAGLTVPVIVTVTGEGGAEARWRSASAMRSTCSSSPVYSVISPEGCAAIPLARRVAIA
jgi:acetyl-CoA carboxylase carboxyl transferase subunit alpha